MGGVESVDSRPTGEGSDNQGQRSRGLDPPVIPDAQSISTGVSTDREPYPGYYNGKSYVPYLEEEDFWEPKEASHPDSFKSRFEDFHSHQVVFALGVCPCLLSQMLQNPHSHTLYLSGALHVKSARKAKK